MDSSIFNLLMINNNKILKKKMKKSIKNRKI